MLGKGLVVQVRVPYLHVLHNLFRFHASVVTLLRFGPAPLWGGEGDESIEWTFVVLHGDYVVHLVVKDGTGDRVSVALDCIEVGDEFAIHVCECLEFFFVHIHEAFHDVQQVLAAVVPPVDERVHLVNPVTHHAHKAKVSVDGNVRVDLGSVEVGEVRLSG
mgnify:CR=1 FL=1